jgi:alkylation response protein AidB-like acyl-CoA dehydrogenase
LVRATLAAPGVLGAAPELVEAETPAGSTLSGAAGLVLDGASADLLIVAADTQNGQLGLFAVEGVAAGLERVATPLIDPTRRFARVVLDNVPARRIDRGGETPLALQRAIDHSTVGLAAEMAGAAQRCVELTVAYVRDRKQFGVSIGSFQAIKHRCANMFIDTDAAREAVYMAADVIASDDLQNVGIAASTAKLAASEAFLEAAAAMIQLHGGIGYTWEHDAHLFYKRALLAARMLGSAAEHRARLAAAFDL